MPLNRVNIEPTKKPASTLVLELSYALFPLLSFLALSLLVLFLIGR